MGYSLDYVQRSFKRLCNLGLFKVYRYNPREFEVELVRPGSSEPLPLPLPLPQLPQDCLQTPVEDPADFLSVPQPELLPQNPVDCPKNPVDCPKNPVDCPKKQASNPHELVISPIQDQ